MTETAKEPRRIRGEITDSLGLEVIDCILGELDEFALALIADFDSKYPSSEYAGVPLNQRALWIKASLKKKWTRLKNGECTADEKTFFASIADSSMPHSADSFESEALNLVYLQGFVRRYIVERYEGRPDILRIALRACEMADCFIQDDISAFAANVSAYQDSLARQRHLTSLKERREKILGWIEATESKTIDQLDSLKRESSASGESIEDARSNISATFAHTRMFVAWSLDSLEEETAASKAPMAPTDNRPDSLLSERQEQVAEAVAEGLSNKQIALRLGISENTVKKHLKEIYAKLGIDSRVALASALFSESKIR